MANDPNKNAGAGGPPGGDSGGSGFLKALGDTLRAAGQKGKELGQKGKELGQKGIAKAEIESEKLVLNGAYAELGKAVMAIWLKEPDAEICALEGTITARRQRVETILKRIRELEKRAGIPPQKAP